MRRAVLILFVTVTTGAAAAREGDGTATTSSAPVAAGESARAEAPMDAARDELQLRGSLRTVGEVELLRFSSTSGASGAGHTDEDVDLRQYASIEALNLGDPHLLARASGRYEYNAAPYSASELRDLSDMEPLRRHVKLFEAYGEAHDLAAGHLRVRAGRQSVDSFEPVEIDGGRADVAASIFRATAYGGLRASVYSGADDAPIVGGEIGVEPARGISFVAGAFHYVVDAFCAQARERVADALSFEQKIEALDDRLSEVEVSGRGRLDPLGLELRLGYTRWFETTRFPYDYSFELARTSGYARLLVGSRTDGDEAMAELIFDEVPHVVATCLGRLFRPSRRDLDPYNLGYDEVTPSLEVYDLPWSGLGAALHYTLYRADAGAPAGIDPTTVEGFTDLRGEGISRYDEVGLDLSQRIARKVRLGGGGILRREDYTDRFGDISNARAWDLYAEVRWLATDRWTFRARYDYAQDLDLIAPDVLWDQRVLLEVQYAF